MLNRIVPTCAKCVASSASVVRVDREDVLVGQVEADAVAPVSAELVLPGRRWPQLSYWTISPTSGAATQLVVLVEGPGLPPGRLPPGEAVRGR